MTNLQLKALFFLTFFFICGCQKAPPPAPVKPLEVVVETVQQKDFPIYGVYIGTTHASLDVEVRARVNGFIQKIVFTEGSLVKKGDLLYQIDNRPYKARVNRLKANLENAQAQMAKTERDVARYKPLYEQDAASQLDLDNALSARDQAKAAVAAAASELEEAQLDLDYTEVRAPISGLVGSSRVDLGGLVGSGGESLLTTIKQVDPMYVNFHMSSLDYLNARRRKASFMEMRKIEQEGKAVEGYVKITLPDNTEYKYWGDVDFTDPQVNPKTGTFAVRAVVPNPDRQLLPGQHTMARFELEVLPGAIVINEKAVQIEQGGSYVMVAMPDGTAERRFIVIGDRYEEDIVVKSGLDKGEEIIVEGFQKVRHGRKIRTISTEDYAKRLEEEAAELDRESDPAKTSEEDKDTAK